tara:strand:+ start:965 stop:1360 length:396 start_codon:yes stop_codon:yes gene_type:complete
MSDLKITHAGTEQTLTSQGPIRPEASLGQSGSMFIDTTAAIAPPDGMVFVAITMVEDCSFNSTNGLVAEDENKWFNSDAAAHNESAASETSLQGSGGVELDDGNVFPAGMTIYGRYIDIKLANGSCIAYLG